MTTDWVLIRRSAGELDARLRGARVRDAGLLADGRIGLVLRAGPQTLLLAFDLFGSPPLVTLEAAELGIAVEPGFVRALAGALTATVLTRVQSRRGDRLLRLTFSSRSRFGVEDTHDLYAELVPRFGNCVLVKGETVVAAAKEFTLAENAARAVAAGMRYALPPLPAGETAVPRLLQREVTPEQLADLTGDPDAMHAPLYVYRRDGRLLQAHLLPLTDESLAGARLSREPSLLTIFAELRATQNDRRSQERSQRRRQALLRRLEQRERGLRRELDVLIRKRADAADRGALRAEGERIFASLHELAEREREEAKESAANIFARYKKLGAALPHVEARERSVETMLESIDALRWEVERAGDDEIDDAEAAVAALDGHGARARPPGRRRKRTPLELRTADGSRILVGRSPAENAEITFRIGRPDDLWFHARQIPGAHVLLARDDRSPAPVQDVETAAALAAFHSKARGSARVAVDYTLRKHVRKRPDAPPGLVWYTHAKTVLAEPKDVPATP
jgi:predicted ribosome quality control (RQC) complex YloA/Tae2 family protein